MELSTNSRIIKLPENIKKLTVFCLIEIRKSSPRQRKSSSTKSQLGRRTFPLTTLMSILQFKEATERTKPPKTSSPHFQPFLTYNHQSHIRCRTQDLETVRNQGRVLFRIPITIRVARTQMPFRHPIRSNLVPEIQAV